MKIRDSVQIVRNGSHCHSVLLEKKEIPDSVALGQAQKAEEVGVAAANDSSVVEAPKIAQDAVKVPQTETPIQGKLPSSQSRDSSKEEDASLAQSASLDEVGYKDVVALRSNSEMKLYIRRVAENMGCQVVSETGLTSLAPFFSGEKKEQTFANLEAEVYKGCMGNDSGIQWLSSMYPHVSDRTPRGQSLLSASSIRLPMAQKVVVSPMAAPAAPITEEGFREVMLRKDHQEMKMFFRRVISTLDGWVVDESGLEGLLPFYNNEKGSQPLAALFVELEEVMQKPDGWVMKAPESLLQLPTLQPAEIPEVARSPSRVTPESPLYHAVAAVSKRVDGASADKEKHKFIPCPEDENELDALRHIASVASLDQAGYESLVLLKNDCAMEYFVIRVAEDLNCHVIERDGLKGVVPFYSGTRGKQDYAELELEVGIACNELGEWVVPKTVPPPLRMAGLQMMATQEDLEAAQGQPEILTTSEDEEVEQAAGDAQEIRDEEQETDGEQQENATTMNISSQRPG
jgi:hypothetical protein